MACCAFAVFLLGQLYMAYEAVTRALGLSPAAADGPTATDWHRGALPAPPAVTARRWNIPAPGGRMALAAGLSVAALATAVATRPVAERFDLAAYLADPAHICGSAFHAEIA